MLTHHGEIHNWRNCRMTGWGPGLTTEAAGQGVGGGEKAGPGGTKAGDGGKSTLDQEVVP